MASEVNTACSSYFRVKDVESFKEWATNRGIAYDEMTIDGEQHFSIYPEAIIDTAFYLSDSGGWSACHTLDENAHEFINRDVIAYELTEHLYPGCVAVLKEFCSLKMDWGAYAVIVRADGEIRFVNLDAAIATETKALGAKDIRW